MRLRAEGLAAALLWAAGMGAGALAARPAGIGGAGPGGAAAAVPDALALTASIALNNLAVYAVLVAGLATGGVLAGTVLAYNGFALGLGIAAALRGGAEALEVAAVLVPHGVLEVPALLVGGAVGLRGWAVARRAFRTGAPSLDGEGRVLLRLVLAGALVLLAAAAVEGVVTRQLLITITGAGG